MRHHLIRLGVVIGAAATALVAAPAVLANAEEPTRGADHAVFVQTNDPTGNSIVAYARHGDGSLSYSATYPTGGRGGRETGAAVDPLASQSSLVYDAEHALLFAPNAGSDSVSVFGVNGDRLHLNQVISSGGPFPSSITVHENLVYVLDAGGPGFVSGYRIAGTRLHPIEGSVRSLSLPNANPPFFLSAPAQVGFTPDGRDLAVSLKGSDGGGIDIFDVLRNGRLSAAPVTTTVGGNAFAFVFDPAGRLVLVNAGFGNVSTYQVNADDTLGLVSFGAPDGQAAACWVASARGNYYAANAGSGTLSQYQITNNGTVVLVNPVAAAGIPGAVDMAVSADQHFLYAQSGGSASVRAFAVNGDGSLTPVALYLIPNGGSQEGIAAF